MKKTKWLLFMSGPLALCLGSSLATAAGSSVLSDLWYTVSQQEKGALIPLQYYNEKIERRTDGKFRVQNDVFVREGAETFEQHLGAVAGAPPELRPDSFNFIQTSKDPLLSLFITGNYKPDQSALIVVKRGASQDATEIKIQKHQKGTFLEVFFPLWLSRELKSLRQGQSVGFDTIFEDDLEGKFKSQRGMVRLDASDDYAKKNNAKKITVNLRSIPTVWWVDSDGHALKIENPSKNSIAERVPKEKALRFFDQKINPPKKPTS